MDKSFFTDIKTLRDAIDSKKLVVFAGAGISYDAGVPGWGTLIDEMRSDIEIPKEEKDYLRIAQMYYNDRQQKEYIEKIRNILKHKKVKYNPIHEEIFNLNPEHILTTNYDDLLEQVIKRKSLPFSIIKRDRDFPYAENTKHLVKIHGDLDDTDIVLKEDDYIDYSINHPLIEGFIKSVFVSKIVLFVGYSFSDINLKMIIQNVRNILGKDFQNAYLLNLDEDFHPAQKEYLKNKGVRVINYFSETDSEGQNFILSFLNGNNALGESYYKKVNSFTEKGQNLLNFLRFISNYDKFNESLGTKNVIDQVYDSLIRFSELKSLPQEFIANLYPFNNSAKYNSDSCRRYAILTKNAKLIDLFFQQIKYDDNEEMVFSPKPELQLSDRQIEEYGNKLKKIIKVLNHSLIYYITKENNYPDSLGNLGWSDNHQKLHFKNNTVCECLNCNYRRYKLDTVIENIENAIVNDTSDIKDDFQIAYCNYNIGNFVKSFHQFEAIANKAWESSKYLLYYIAKHNIKTLNNLINYESNLQEEERKGIIKTIEDIDFDKLLFQVPYTGESQYTLLKIIRDDDVLKRSEKEIEDCLVHAEEIYELYQRPGSSFSGTYYPAIINREVHKIKAFYLDNFIISDVFNEFRIICDKAIKALFIFGSVSDQYEQKLKEYDKLFFDITVAYGYARKLEDVIKKYKIENIKFNPKDLTQIIESVNVFLRSFFDQRTFFGPSVTIKKSIKKQLTVQFFATRCREKFSNMFLLLSLVKLDLEKSMSLIENLLLFLEVQDFLYHHSLKPLSLFIEKNHQLFDEVTAAKILKLISEKSTDADLSELIESISYVYEKNKLNLFSNREIILKIYYDQSKDKHNKKFLLPLWVISDDKIREMLSKEIIESLNEKFDEHLYTRASLKTAIDYNLFLKNYIDYIEINRGSGEYSIIDGKVIADSWIFLNAMSFLYGREGISTLKLFEKSKKLSAYMQFYIDPENFDYTKFKSEWLLFLKSPIFYKRFGKIKALVKKVKIDLSEKFNSELSEIYFKYLA
jgi:hypothetical protein